MSNQFQPMGQVLGGKSDAVKEFSSGVLKIRGKTLILGNSIFYIPNISALEVNELYSVRKPVPILMWLFIISGLGVTILGEDNIRLIGLVLVIVAAFIFLIWELETNRPSARYGLIILLNSGLVGSPIVVSDDQEFLTKIALVIYNIMNGEDIQSVTFNLDQRQVVDMNNLSGSVVILGDITGDIANNV